MKGLYIPKSFLMIVLICWMLIGCIKLSQDVTNQTVNKNSENIVTQDVLQSDVLSDSLESNDKCSNSIRLTPKQADYQGILPGKASDQELEMLIGKPDKVQSIENDIIWSYSPPSPSFTIRAGVVEEIAIGPALAGSYSYMVGELIEKYGCPDLIFALDTRIHKNGSYNETLFVQLQSGVEFFGELYPPNWDDDVTGITYFPPMSVDDYLNAFGGLNDSMLAQQVFWHDIFNK